MAGFMNIHLERKVCAPAGKGIIRRGHQVKTATHTKKKTKHLQHIEMTNINRCLKINLQESKMNCTVH